ncbi:MAG: glycosyltransferase family 2 protein [Anaerolineales bacterium]
MLDLSVIIVNWNTRELLIECLTALARNIGTLSAEVIVVDNASTDGSREFVLQRFPAIRWLTNQENVGFARANNQGAALAQGRYLLLLNTDAFLQVDALTAMLRLAQSRPRAGLVGAHLLNADKTFQAGHSPFPTLWQEFLILSGMGRLIFGRHFPSRGPQNDREPRSVDYVEGACMLIRREAYAQAGGLDEGYFMYAEEVDLCYTLRQYKWEVWYAPEAYVIHLGGASSRIRRPEREGDLYTSRVRFFRKHYGAPQASALKALIYTFTAIKIAWHTLLRLASGGRFGRPVVSLRSLAAKLRAQ